MTNGYFSSTSNLYDLLSYSKIVSCMIQNPTMMTIAIKLIMSRNIIILISMKKVPNIILFVLKSKANLVHSTATHHQYVNKIFCHEQDLLDYNMNQYIDKQMQNYPISKQTKSIKKDSNITKHNRSTSTQLIKYAYEFVNKSNYLLLQETRQLLNSMSESEVQENEMNLQMLRKSIYECMTREQLEQHASYQISILLSEISDLQKGKLTR